MSMADNFIPARPAPPAIRRTLSRSAIVGHAALGVWAVLALGLAYLVITGWDPAKFVKYGPRYLSGVWVTFTLVGVSIIGGAILSLPVAFARMSGSRILNAISYAYVYIFRGTPLLAQLYLIYYGVGSFKPQLEAVGLWWFFRDAWYCGFLSLTLNTAAYQAEILRGAIESVPRGQREGARSLGIPERVSFFKIILPQALIVALRPYGNEIILMIKGSAVVAVVTVLDIMGETRYTFSRTFDYQAYLWAAIFYLAIVETLRHVWGWLERRLTRHLKR